MDEYLVLGYESGRASLNRFDSQASRREFENYLEKSDPKPIYRGNDLNKAIEEQNLFTRNFRL